MAKRRRAKKTARKKSAAKKISPSAKKTPGKSDAVLRNISQRKSSSRHQTVSQSKKSEEKEQVGLNFATPSNSEASQKVEQLELDGDRSMKGRFVLFLAIVIKVLLLGWRKIIKLLLISTQFFKELFSLIIEKGGPTLQKVWVSLCRGTVKGRALLWNVLLLLIKKKVVIAKLACSLFYSLCLRLWQMILITCSGIFLLWKRRPAVIIIIVCLCVFFALIPIVSLTVVVKHYWEQTESFRLEQVQDMAYTTLVYDRNDKLIQRLFDEYRLRVEDEDIPENMKLAVIATEDQRFYDHLGIDPIAILRAAIGNLTESRIRSGASTITQQLARNTVNMFERTYDRKIKEMVMAFRIEQKYSKDEIINLYLNRIFFGRNIYGIGAAADSYFGKEAKDLELHECAMLAGIISSPNSSSPWRRPEEAKKARRRSLSRMLNLGYITQEEFDVANNLPLGVKAIETLPGSYVISAMREELPASLTEKHLFQGGLKIYTTIDIELQKLAEEGLDEGLTAIEGWKGYRHTKREDFTMPEEGEVAMTRYLQGAFVCIHNADGGVLSIVGGRSAEESNFNRAIFAKRQVGSTIKPFVYTHAFNMLNMSAFTEIDQSEFDLTVEMDWPMPFEMNLGVPDYISVRQALRRSNNFCTMRAGLAAGKETFPFLINQLTDENIPPFQSSFLGACEIAPYQMVQAYSVFPNYGKLIQPYIIERIENAEGNIIYQHKEESKQVLSPQVAFQINDILQDVVNAGTGAALKSRYGLEGSIGGKTGTTNDYKDCWFMGFSKDVTAGVFVGFDEPKTIMSRGYSSRIAVPVWGRIMKEFFKTYSTEAFEVPAGLRRAERQQRVVREVRYVPEQNFLFWTRPASTRVIERVEDVSDGLAEYIRIDQEGGALARLDDAVRPIGSEIHTTDEDDFPFVYGQPQMDQFSNMIIGQGTDINDSDIPLAVPLEDGEPVHAPRAVPLQPDSRLTQ
ncbi:MAG: transglycosylase domain-containing protein [Verrucomicrobiota bacterium]